MKPFCVMITDTFEYVCAENEDAAKAEIVRKVKAGELELAMIAWENSEEACHAES